jgi:hypothetical protein
VVVYEDSGQYQNTTYLSGFANGGEQMKMGKNYQFQSAMITMRCSVNNPMSIQNGLLQFTPAANAYGQAKCNDYSHR